MLYRAALAAVLTGAFSPADAGMRFVAALGGVPVGLAVAAVVDAERDAVLDLFAGGALHDELLRRIERDLDLEELRMEA